MASVNSDQYGAAIARPGAGPGGDTKVLFGSVELTAAQSANDTVNFFTAPAGFTPLFGWLYGDDIDTGTEVYEFDIGTAADPDAYLNSGVITGDAVTGTKPEVGISIPLGGTLITTKPTELTADTDIIGTVVAAPNAGGTGTLTLIMFGVYNDVRVV